MVGPEELVVRIDQVSPPWMRNSLGVYRTWVLIIGMTGLIVLFWFVAGGVALRYFVRRGPLRLGLMLYWC